MTRRTRRSRGTGHSDHLMLVADLALMIGSGYETVRSIRHGNPVIASIATGLALYGLGWLAARWLITGRNR